MLFYDDASTDDTLSILQSKGLNVIKGDINKGPGYARNRLTEAATGKYIHFHDIDDELDPSFLELIDPLLVNTQVDIIIGHADWIDSETRQPIIKWRYNQDELTMDPVGYLLSHPVGIINTVYRKDIFIAAGGFNEEIKCWEDADVHVRLAAINANFMVINKTLAYSIRHNNGISKDQQWCWQCRLQFLEQYANTFDIQYKLALGKEFENTAYALFNYKKYATAAKAFRHSRALGFNAPTVGNRLLMRIKQLSPFIAFFVKACLLKTKN